MVRAGQSSAGPATLGAVHRYRLHGSVARIGRQTLRTPGSTVLGALPLVLTTATRLAAVALVRGLALEQLLASPVVAYGEPVGIDTGLSVEVIGNVDRPIEPLWSLGRARQGCSVTPESSSPTTISSRSGTRGSDRLRATRLAPITTEKQTIFELLEAIPQADTLVSGGSAKTSSKTMRPERACR